MINNVKSKFAMFLVMIFVVISFAGCSQKPLSTVEKIKKSGKLVLGTSADYPPYEFHKEINGKDEVVGFDIEIAKEIAKELGVELEIKDMKFDGLLAALTTGNVDIVIAGMNPSEERKQSVDFSQIYYKAKQSVIVRAEDKDKYKSLSDLKDKKIGVQKATTQEQAAKDEIEGAQITSLSKLPDLILQLQNKRVDAVVIEHTVAIPYVEKNKDLIITDISFSNNDKGAAIAIKKGNTDFLELVDKTLSKLIEEKKIDEFIVNASKMNE